jgi:hypothetical protein
MPAARVRSQGLRHNNLNVVILFSFYVYESTSWTQTVLRAAVHT